jgi:hypothetical protein
VSWARDWFTKAGQAGQDLVSGFGPHEGLGMLIADLDITANGLRQFPRGAVDPPANLFFHQGSQSALDQVQPERSREREIQMEAVMAH